MSDFILADGREITFDLDKLTYGQWVGLFSPTESEERSDKTLARVSGLEVKELKALKILEYKKLLAALRKRVQEPLSDPNA
jgi:hypothetical protein